jgi:tripeptide aminopeptidase
MATDYISHFDRQQTPECTEGREGYIWFNGIQAGQNEAILKANIRDFDKDALPPASSRLPTWPR